METSYEREIYAQLFKGISQVGFVSPKAKGALNKRMKIVEFKKDEIVLEKGAVCRYCYFVVSGLLRAYFEKRGKDVTAWFMTTGDVAIGVSSFYRQTASKEFIVAMEDTICVRLSYEDLQWIYKNCIDFNVIGRCLTEKYHELFTVRLSEIVDEPKERYLKLQEEYPHLVDGSVPLEHLASYLGMSLSTLTRIRRGLKKKEMVI